MPQHEAAGEHGIVTGCNRCAAPSLDSLMLVSLRRFDMAAIRRDRMRHVEWHWWCKTLLASNPLNTAKLSYHSSSSLGMPQTSGAELFEFALEVLLEIGVAAEADVGELAALGVALAGGFAVLLA